MDAPASPFDPPAYARRIGLSTMPDPTIEGVRALVYAHATTLPFENLDAFLGRGVDLDPAAVVRKLVSGRRGGWCFEHNLLLGLALRSLGFAVTDLAAQVLWFRAAGIRSPRTHRLLLLEHAGRRYLADVGFGAVTLTDLLVLEADVEQQTSHETHRLSQQDGMWLLEVRLGAAWQPVYRFDLSPWWPEDFVPVNYQLSRDPESSFVKSLHVARATPTGRLALRDAQFTRRGLDGSAQTRQLRDVAEILDLLESEFGIAASSLPGVGERLMACLLPPPQAPV